jgi:Flp pilus assembly protein TadB
MLLTAMPFIVAALLFVMNRSYISLLWTTPIGLAMLAVAGVMLAIGSMMLRKLSTIDV